MTQTFILRIILTKNILTNLANNPIREQSCLGSIQRYNKHLYISPPPYIPSMEEAAAFLTKKALRPDAMTAQIAQGLNILWFIV